MSLPTLALRTTQKAALTPRLQQSVRLLQLSSGEFAEELEQASATNPFLELVSSGVASATQRHDDSGRTHVHADPAFDTAAIGPSVFACAESRSGDDSHGSLDGTDDAGHFFDVASASGRSPHRDGGPADVGLWMPSVPTLRMHLRAGLPGHRLDARGLALAEMVIEAIDDDGYIRQDLGDVAMRFAFDPPVDDEELAIALRLVQQIGPAGIAARNASECLALQLEQKIMQGGSGRMGVFDTALAIVRHHLVRLAARDHSAIQRELGCAAADVVAAAAVIRTLDPRPGSAFVCDVAQPVVPDVLVRRGRGGWLVDVNPAVVPRVALNRFYADLFNETRGRASSASQPLVEQLQEARWLMRNTTQRFLTITRVARLIVAEQSSFLDYGDIAIKPLLLREVADKLELHESTISRAIGNKFMATPRGTFAFKHFFSRKLATTSGGSCSATSIRAAMRELIEREDRHDPMSDVVLASRLGAQGICVARRTVTKYRALMRIPPVEMRRTLRRESRSESRV